MPINHEQFCEDTTTTTTRDGLIRCVTCRRYDITHATTEKHAAQLTTEATQSGTEATLTHREGCTTVGQNKHGRKGNTIYCLTCHAYQTTN